MHPPHELYSIVDPALVGLAILSVLALAYSVGTVRLHLADKKLRKEESIIAILLTPFPPAHILTAGGRVRARIGKIALCILCVIFVALVTRIFRSRS